MSLLGAVNTFQGRGRTGSAGATNPDEYLAIIDATNIAGSLVAHWRFNGNLNERIAARHATLGAGVAAFAGGLPNGPGSSFDCAGANWLSVTHHAVLKPAVGALMVWCRPDTIHNGVLASCNAAGFLGNDFALRVNDNGTVSCFFQVGGTSTLVVTGTSYYGINQTINAIVTWDSSGISLYLDGNHIGSDTAHTTGLSGNSLNWRFGEQEDSSTIFNGPLDEIALWNRVLTRSEIYLLAQTEPS